MRTTAAICAALLALGCSGETSSSGGTSSAGAIEWITDAQAGFDKVGETGKPAALYFYADW